MNRRRRDDVIALRLELAGSEPLVWRLLEVRADTTLASLHRIIQIVMDWTDHHLYEFDVRGEHYEAADPEATGKDAARMTLLRLRLEVGDRFSYVYDPGDDWLHEISVVEIQPVDDMGELPCVIDGPARVRSRIPAASKRTTSSCARCSTRPCPWTWSTSTGFPPIGSTTASTRPR